MRVLYLALKDLLQIVRDWKAAFFLVIMPIAFTLLFGFAFGGFSGVEDADPRLPVDLLDQDSSLQSQALISSLNTSEVIRIEAGQFTESDLENRVTEAEMAAAIIVPAGYGEQLLKGSPLPLIVIADQSNNSGFAIQGEIESVASRLVTAQRTAEVSSRLLEERKGFDEGASPDEFFAATFDQALLAWEQPPINVKSAHSGLPGEDGSEEENAFAQTSPGMMAQFAIAGLMGASAVLVLERKNRSMQRLLTTPITKAEILLGHYLAMFVMIFVQLLILIVFAQLFLRLDYFREPLATLLMAVATALFAASLGLLIGALAKSEEQVIVFALIPMFVLAALGGAWVPLEIMPEGFQSIARLTPVAWIMDGFRDIVLRGQGLEAVWLAAAVLAGYALIIFLLAIWRFRYE
jgi:ABC-2 type transport system permease protein